jgi:uncharacterized protein (TIRG00374 family)
MTTHGKAKATGGRAAEPAPARRGLSLRGILQLAVGVGALALVILKSDAQGIAEALRNTRAAYLPLAVLASFLVTWLMAYRWSVILAARGFRFRVRRLFAYYLIGSFFTNFVPGGSLSGDLARLIYIDREVRDKAFVLSTLVYERLVGMFTLLLVGLAATLISRRYVQTDPAVYLVEAILALAFIAIAALMSEAVSTRIARLVESVSAKFKVRRIGEAAARTILAISGLRRHKGLLARTVLISALIRVVWGLGCYVVSQAMGLPLTLPIVFAFISLADLIRLMPISIGGLGVREWALVALFASVDISQEKALTFSLLVFAPIYLNAITGGIIYISRARLVRKEKVAELDLNSSEA